MQLKCEVHREEPLDLICLDSGCPQQGAVCFLCKLEDHSAHDPIIPLRHFLDTFIVSRTNSQPFVRQTAQIDCQFVLIQRALSKLKNRRLDYSLLGRAYLRYWKEAAEQVLSFDCIVKDLTAITSSSCPHTRQQLNIWIRRHSSFYEVEIEAGGKDSIYVVFMQNKLDALQGIAEDIEWISEKPLFDDMEILSLFETEKRAGLSKLKMHFSEKLMGACMTIHSPTRLSMTKAGGQRMVLLEPSLSQTRSVKKWKVRIEKLDSWIGVGVAHLDSIKAVNFDFSYTGANHGNYLISSNGYSWNGYKMEFNSKLETFTFTTGSVVEIAYDPAASKITFSKENHEQSFTYDIDPSQKPIHAALNLTGLGDSVQVIY